MTDEGASSRRQSSPAVLVVEDHDTSGDGYAQLLTAAGYRVLRARNGYEALGEVSRQSPSLVILDLKIPKLDGWGLIDRMKADAATSSVPIVIVTGDALATHHDLARSRGAVAVLIKPIQPDEFLTTVREALTQPAATN